MKEFTQRLQNAAGDEKDLPQVFWYAATSLMVEMLADFKYDKMQEFMTCLYPYSPPAVMNKLVNSRYLHPGCYDDLRNRMRFELTETGLYDEVQAMAGKLYYLWGYKCCFTIWEEDGVSFNNDVLIRHYNEQKLKMFCEKFCTCLKEEPVISDNYFPRTLQEQAYIFKKCWSNNISAEESKELVQRLQKGCVTGFLICALSAHSFPKKVVEQIEQTDFGGGSDEYLQQLCKRWVRMILFASKIKPGMKYYVPDITSSDKVQELVWDNDDTDNRVFGNGLCFIHKEEAAMFANKLLGMI